MGSTKLKLDKKLFFTTVIFTVLMTVLFLVYPDFTKNILLKVQHFLIFKLGFVFLWAAFLTVCALIVIAFSKIGKIKLGSKDDKPQFSTIVWLGMILTSCTGASILYWGTVEWSYYFMNRHGQTPFHTIPGSWQAAEWSSSFALFHTGIVAWSFYAIFAVAIAYIYHVKKRPVLKLSEACTGTLIKSSDSWIGRIIDVCFIFGIMGGTATSFGFVAPMVTAGICKIFGIEPKFYMEIVLMLVWMVLNVYILLAGLKKGIEKISKITMSLFYVFLAFVLIVGPTVFIINNFTSAFGQMLNNFISMSMWTDPIKNSGFPQNWTVFFWAWWLVYAPTTGIFLAKISKGRTIRQLIIGSVIGGSAGCWLIYSILGNFAMNLQLKGIFSVSKLIAAGKNPGEVIAGVIAHLPFSTISLIVFVLLAFTYSSTIFNAISYTLASTTTKKITEDSEPAKWNRVFWNVLIAAISIAIMTLGGLDSLKVASVATALPIAIILIFVVMAFFKNIKNTK
ncbi:MAG TPA: BCCT family transporter [Victivallales bacterium]|nr:BCCT family transporter [Victivallales bacterium]